MAGGDVVGIGHKWRTLSKLPDYVGSPEVRRAFVACRRGEELLEPLSPLKGWHLELGLCLASCQPIPSRAEHPVTARFL